jgi:hypothetical protein
MPPVRVLIVTSCTAGPALYLGQQHLRVMEAVRQVPEVDLWIFSANHGPSPG